MKYSVRKISEMTGYSPATVSNALNNKKGVNSETSERIWRIAREIGYINASKVNDIKFVMYKKDGQVVADTPFFAFLIDKIESCCREAGYQTIMYNINQSKDDYAHRLDEILNGSSSAVLLLATELTTKDMSPFERVKCPLVVMDAWFGNMKFDTVLANNEDSVFDATTYLIEKGHKRIGYLAGNIRIQNFKQRGLGYKKAMLKHGLGINPSYEISLTPTMEGSHKDMFAYLSTSPELPTAFIADNDIIALGAMKALRQHGYKIPHDVSIIGFDDIPFCEISSPALTTIKFHQDEMGKIAVERLVQKIKGSSIVTSKIQIGTSLVLRESVRDLNA